MVYLTTRCTAMYYDFYISLGNSKSETESMKIKNSYWKWFDTSTCSDVNLRAPHCLVARTPLFKISCAQWLFMYACSRTGTDHSHSFYTGSWPCRNYHLICHGTRGHILNYVMARRGVLTNHAPKPLSDCLNPFYVPGKRTVRALGHYGKSAL